MSLQGHHNSFSTSEKFYLSQIPRREDFQIRLEAADLHHSFISKAKNNNLPRIQGTAEEKKNLNLSTVSIYKRCYLFLSQLKLQFITSNGRSNIDKDLVQTNTFYSVNQPLGSNYDGKPRLTGKLWP